MTIRALIFDFDGVILDTETPEYESWQEVYRSFGAELPLSMWALAVGRGTWDQFEPYAYLEQQIGRSVDRAALTAARLRRDSALIAAQPPMPGVESLLADAKRRGIRRAIASSSPYSWVGGHLMRLGLLDWFDTIKTKDDVTNTKPDPELFLAACSALDVEPEEAVVIEDSPNGIAAARRAGILVIAVPNRVTAQMPLDDADLILSSLADLSLDHLIAHLPDRRNGRAVV